MLLKSGLDRALGWMRYSPVPRSSRFIIELSPAEKPELHRRASNLRYRIFRSNRRDDPLRRRRAHPQRDCGAWTPAVKWFRLGASAFSPTGSPGWKSMLVQVAPGLFSPDLVVPIKAGARVLSLWCVDLHRGTGCPPRQNLWKVRSQEWHCIELPFEGPPCALPVVLKIEGDSARRLRSAKYGGVRLSVGQSRNRSRSG